MFNRIHTLIRALCLVVLGTSLAATAMATEPVSKHVSDATIKSIVERNLEQHRLTAKYGADIHVAVDDHIIVLSGTVPSLTVLREAEEQAWHAKNGVRVENHLSVATSHKTDDQLAEDVARALRRYPRYDIFDWVEGKVQDGIVTLTGAVRQPYRKADYERLVEDVAGIKQVQNELRVLPLSTFDDQIRLAASRAIYRDPLFTRYGFQALPPIHIIVENGKVLLKGVVATSMERQVAEADVRSNVTAFDVINELQVEQAG